MSLPAVTSVYSCSPYARCILDVIQKTIEVAYRESYSAHFIAPGWAYEVAIGIFQNMGIGGALLAARKLRATGITTQDLEMAPLRLQPIQTPLSRTLDALESKRDKEFTECFQFGCLFPAALASALSAAMAVIGTINYMVSMEKKTDALIKYINYQNSSDICKQMNQESVSYFKSAVGGLVALDVRWFTDYEQDKILPIATIKIFASICALFGSAILLLSIAEKYSGRSGFKKFRCLTIAFAIANIALIIYAGYQFVGSPFSKSGSTLQTGWDGCTNL